MSGTVPANLENELLMFSCLDSAPSAGEAVITVTHTCMEWRERGAVSAVGGEAGGRILRRVRVGRFMLRRTK